MGRNARSFAGLTVLLTVGMGPGVAFADDLDARAGSRVVACDEGADLGAAIAAAKPGASLRVSGRCVGVFTIDKSLRLRGQAPSTVLDAAGQGTTLTIGEDAEVTVIGVTITGGSGTAVGPAPSTLIGGGVVVHGRLMLRDSTVTRNRASESDVPTVDTGQGAGIWNDGWLRLDGVIVADNEARAFLDEGGGLWNGGHAELNDTVVAHNVASGFDGRGGGVYNAESGVLEARRSRVEANTSSGRTGAGGGVFSRGRATFERTDVTGNTQSGFSVSGGGIENAGTLELRRLELRGNQVSGAVSAAGGGLMNRGPATIERVAITGNAATASPPIPTGGGIADRQIGERQLRLVRTSVSGNTPNDCDPADICP